MSITLSQIKALRNTLRDTDSTPYHISYFDTMPSTQDYLIKRAALKPDGTVVVAQNQTAGRGRSGRRWISPSGSLTFSMLIRPRILPHMIGVVQAAVAISLCRVISKCAKCDAVIKWPNDILVDNCKVAGIITDISLQDQIQWVVVGIGVNVSCDDASLTSIDYDLSYAGPASLIGYNPDISPITILGEFLRTIRPYHRHLRAGDTSGIMSEYRLHLTGVGHRTTVHHGHHTIHGTLLEVDDTGSILLETDSGPRLFNWGDIISS